MSMEMIASGGWATALVFLFMWWNERKENIELGHILRSIVEQELIKAVNEMKKEKDSSVQE